MTLDIPALKPGTVAYEVADNTAELETAYARTIEHAQRHGTAADLEAAERAYSGVHERVFTTAYIRMRKRASLRPARSLPHRPRCRARRPRPRAHRRRGGGRGGGGDGDPDPPEPINKGAFHAEEAGRE